MAKTKSSYDSILKYTGLFGGIQGIITLITIIRSKLVAILLGPLGIGINETYNRTLNLVKSTTDLGLSFSAVKLISEHNEIEKKGNLEDAICTMRSWGVITAITGSLATALLAPLFSLWSFDGDRTYTIAFLLLSPSVAFSAINGCEMAVLKGTRMLKQIALAQLLTVVAGLLISIPLFYIFGLLGLVPSLILVSGVSMIVTLLFSTKAHRYRVNLRWENLCNGINTIKIGIYFTLASFFGAGAFSIIVNFLMNNASAETTGIYSAGYLIVSYLGMFVFSAMESDYFPRLSAINNNTTEINQITNMQIQATSLVLSPLITAFIISLPLLVVIFTSSKFTDAIPMALFAVPSLATKAMTQPVAYISLAKGDSRTFLLQEVLYDIILVTTVILGYKLGGLQYVGIAITLSGICDWIIVWIIASRRYHFAATSQTYKVFFMQMPLLVATILFSQIYNGWRYWIIGSLLFILSTLLSLYLLKKHTLFLQKLQTKLKLFFSRE